MAAMMMSTQELIALANSRPVRAASVPVIDISYLNQQHHASRSIVVQDIGHACQKFGCFQVRNHGINKSVTAGALEAASNFFALSANEKAEIASGDITKPVRYGSEPTDGIMAPRFFLKQYAHPLNEWIHLWPCSPPDYREKMGRYAIEVRTLALKLMGAILESLGLDQTYLKDELDEGIQLMTVNCYPQSSSSSGTTPEAVGIAPHSDYGFITIVLQSCQGLQVVDRRDAAWCAAPDVPDTLHVHIGDHLEVLSNGRYKTVVHRAVRSAESTRISVASIQSLLADAKVAAAAELVDEQNPKGYEETSFGEFLQYLSTTNAGSGSSFIDSLRIL